MSDPTKTEPTYEEHVARARGAGAAPTVAEAAEAAGASIPIAQALDILDTIDRRLTGIEEALTWSAGMLRQIAADAEGDQDKGTPGDAG